MSLKLIITNKVDRGLWDDFVERHPLGTIFHHSLWHDVICKSYGYRTYYYVIMDNCRTPQAALAVAHIQNPLTGYRLISYPFSDTCDPLIQTSDQLNLLLGALKEHRMELKAKSIQLRFGKARSLLNIKPSFYEYETHSLSLKREPSAIFNSFHKSCIQRAIKRADKQAVTIISGKSEEDLRSFYSLHLLTRKKHGVPAQPYSFFRQLWRTLFPREMISLLLAKYHHNIIAGIIVLWFNEVAWYKFGAADDRFSHLRANQLLMWKAIQIACHNRCKRFDFGRTSTANQGLATYKARWGTTTEPLYYLHVPMSSENSILNESSSQHILLKKVMTRMPTLVIRLSGDLLYKYLA